MDVPEIVLLAGQIASGKSTLTSQLAKDGYIVSNDDAIVTSVHGGDYRLYDGGLKLLYKSIEHTLISTSLSLGRGVVVDRTCLNKYVRRRYISMAEGFDVPIRVIVFPMFEPKVHAQRRVSSDARGYDLEYWTKVATYLAGKSDPITEQEGFSQIQYWDHDQKVLHNSPTGDQWVFKRY